jgi:hypothetical protein
MGVIQYKSVKVFIQCFNRFCGKHDGIPGKMHLRPKCKSGFIMNHYGWKLKLITFSESAPYWISTKSAKQFTGPFMALCKLCFIIINMTENWNYLITRGRSLPYWLSAKRGKHFWKHGEVYL